jgi:NADH dehydrogenase FAD-containing subunit
VSLRRPCCQRLLTSNSSCALPHNLLKCVNAYESNSVITADIYIVGSGAAGITLATELDGGS